MGCDRVVCLRSERSFGNVGFLTPSPPENCENQAKLLPSKCEIRHTFENLSRAMLCSTSTDRYNISYVNMNAPLPQIKARLTL